MNDEFVFVLEEYKKRYIKIFQTYYPANASTGFTERNQSVNFCCSFEKLYPDSIIWYEVPFGEKFKQHFDAVVVDPIGKRILIIESKRFTNSVQKIHSVGEDIERITKQSNIDNIVQMVAEYNKEMKNYAVHGVFLADVWTENKDKLEIATKWNSDFFAELLKKTDLSDEISNNMKKNIDTIWKIDFPEVGISSIKDKYNLLVCIWKISVANCYG